MKMVLQLFKSHFGQDYCIGLMILYPLVQRSIKAILKIIWRKTMEIKAEFLFDMRINFDRESIIRIGETPYGDRSIIYVTGGTIKGPKVKATVLPGGGDWILRRKDTVSLLDVRIAARLDDKELLYICYQGYLIIKPEQLKQIYKGKSVAPSDYYFRALPLFETASQKYAWLNKIISVAVGEILPGAVAYSVYALL